MGELLEPLRAALADRYAIERELGSGGMAVVYLAEDLKHHRSVALKVLKPELAGVLGPDRFLREIELSARLTHPHILPLLDSGRIAGAVDRSIETPEARSPDSPSPRSLEFLYYTMPYVEGESLRDRLNREKQLPVDDALKVSREVADALSYAHAHGVIHRDIKPENILLQSGHAVVADFGIARAISAAGGAQLTETGMAVGTPAYMSPEQAAGGRDVDGRSDLYSLGCVLYEMLVGQPPFTGPTVESVVHQHLVVVPRSITELRPAVPSWVASALQRALAKNPADRFNPVTQFAEALGPQGPTGAVTSEPLPVAGRAWRWPALLVVAAVVVIAVAVALGRSLRQGGTGYPRTAIAVLPFQNLSADGAYAYFAGGLHDELLTQLAKVAAISVRGRTSVAGYSGTTKPIPQIADELAVGTIVEGSVQVVGERLRVNVTLIDAATDEPLWADRYDRTLDDAFAVQTDIAQHIVTAVDLALSGPEASAIAAAPTDDPEAYRLYLEGETYRRRRFNRENLERARLLLERALSRDSTFAVAWASLADVEGLLYWEGYDRHPRRLAQQRRAAEAAVRLAPDLPQARWAMAMVHYWGEGDYARALAELTLAAEALPGSAELCAYVAYAQRRLGNWDQALVMFEKATVLDPRDPVVLDEWAATLFLLHRYADALLAVERALELASDNWTGELGKGAAYAVGWGTLDTLRDVVARGPGEFGAFGPKAMWQARLALWYRRPEVALDVAAASGSTFFESQDWREPVLLYVGWAHQLGDDQSAAAAAFARALAQVDSVLAHQPDDHRLHQARGHALAGLGRRDQARDEAEWLRQSPAWTDMIVRGQVAEERAKIFANAGLVAEAVGELASLLVSPSWVSVHTLRVDPRYDRIRDDPRFQALLVEYATPRVVR